jgi:membrane protein DedA with SNARE-associated domain
VVPLGAIEEMGDRQRHVLHETLHGAERSASEPGARRRSTGTDSVQPVTDVIPRSSRPPWAPLTLVAFVGLVVCTNIAGVSWAKLLESSPETLLLLSSRNRYLALALGADVSTLAYWTVGPLRIAAAFVVCHLIGRAYADDALRWFVKYLGVTPEALEQFNQAFAKAELIVVPFFAGSNLVAALSGVHRTSWRRLVLLLTVGIYVRLALIWWLAHVFDEQLTSFLSWLQKYSWWAVGISFALVLVVNARNFRRGAAR